jgi:tetratricopeptide (TPR) repeat protein
MLANTICHMVKEPEFPEGLERITLGMLRGSHRQLAEEVLEHLPEEYATIINNDSSVLELCRISEQLQRKKGINRKAAKKMSEFVRVCNQTLQYIRMPPAQSRTEHLVAGETTRIFRRGPYVDKLGPDTLTAAVGRQTSAKKQTQELLGARRIFIELEDRPADARKYAEQYTALVQSIANALMEMGIKPHEEERFITETWGILNSNLRISKTESSLVKAVAGNGWDCDNSSFLIFDVARELKVPLEIVSVPGHAFVATKKFYFETTFGGYFPIQKLPEYYPLVFSKTSDVEQIHAISYSVRADERLENGDCNGAIRDYNEAIRRSPEDPTYYCDRAHAHFNNGDNDLGIKDLEEAIRRSPKYGIAYHALGDVRYQLRQYNLAIENLSNAIMFCPKHMDAGYRAEVYLSRGKAYSMKGDWTAAAKDFAEAIRLEPGNREAYGLFMTASEKANLTTAEKSPSQSAMDRGRVHLDNKEYELAIREYTKAARLEPENEWAYTYRGDAYSKSGNEGMAKKSYSMAALCRGKRNLLAGYPEQAIGEGDLAIRLDPKNADAYEMRSAAHLANGDLGRAIKDNGMATQLRRERSG